MHKDFFQNMTVNENLYQMSEWHYVYLKTMFEVAVVSIKSESVLFVYK